MSRDVFFMMFFTTPVLLDSSFRRGLWPRDTIAALLLANLDEDHEYLSRGQVEVVHPLVVPVTTSSRLLQLCSFSKQHVAMDDGKVSRLDTSAKGGLIFNFMPQAHWLPQALAPVTA